MLVATLLGWSRLNHGHAPFVGALIFYGWVIVYLVSPALVGLIRLRNERTDPADPSPAIPSFRRPCSSPPAPSASGRSPPA